jgi:hypothetical protein
MVKIGTFSATSLLVAAGLITSLAAAYDIRSLDTGRNGKHFSIAMIAWVEQPIDEVRSRLTNFNALTRLSPAVEESRQLPPDEAGDIIVYTRFRPCVMFVCKTVRIFETVRYPERYQIVSTVIAARSDLAFGQTYWRLSVQGDGTLVQYDAEFEPAFDLFPLIGPAVARYSLKREAKQFLKGLEDHR